MALYYQIHPCTVPWDSSYKHAVRFDSQLDREDYFSIDWTNAPHVNLDYGAAFHTSVIVDTGLASMWAGQYNYAVVADSDNTTYYYYFITGAEYVSQGKYRYSLEMDVLQMSLFGTDFGDCVIHRAHLDRWTKIAQNYYDYNFSPDSALFQENDFTELSKRLTYRANLGIDVKNNTLSQWIIQNIKAWRYYFVDTTEFWFDYFHNQDTQVEIKFNSLKYKINERELPLDYCVLCEPIYKNSNNRMYMRLYDYIDLEEGAEPGVKDYCFGEGAVLDWQYLTKTSSNKEYPNIGFPAHVYSTKVSNIPPFGDMSAASVLVSGGNIYISASLQANDMWYVDFNMGQNDRYNLNIHRGNPSLFDYVFFCVSSQTIVRNDLPFLQTYFGVTNDISLNSRSATTIKRKSNKLCFPTLSQKIRELRISTGTPEKKSFDIRFFGSDLFNLKFYIVAPISVYSSTEYICPILKPQNSSPLYNADLYKSYFGYLQDIDDVASVSVNQLQSYVASNKNFKKAFDFNFLSEKTKNFGNYIIDLVTGQNKNPVSRGASGLFNALSERYIQEENLKMNLENMENSPESLTKGANDIYFNFAVSDLSVFEEYYTAIEFEENAIKDYYLQYGYSYGRIGQISDFINIRKHWNYIRADLVKVEPGAVLNFSEDFRQRVKEVFANGVTWWNDPNEIGDYSLQNYENYLDD